MTTNKGALLSQGNVQKKGTQIGWTKFFSSGGEISQHLIAAIQRGFLGGWSHRIGVVSAKQREKGISSHNPLSLPIHRPPEPPAEHGKQAAAPGNCAGEGSDSRESKVDPATQWHWRTGKGWIQRGMTIRDSGAWSVRR